MDAASAFVEKAVARHGDRYDYGQVLYVNMRTPVIIVCRLHGSFEQRPTQHAAVGHGCPTCAYEQKGAGRALTKDEWLRRFAEAHGERYDYSSVGKIRADQPIQVRCRIHGEFRPSPAAHAKGSGCRRCSQQERADAEARVRASEFTSRAANVRAVVGLAGRGEGEVRRVGHGGREGRPGGPARHLPGAVGDGRVRPG